MVAATRAMRARPPKYPQGVEFGPIVEVHAPDGVVWIGGLQFTGFVEFEAADFHQS
jgi:hypothetical protein